MIKLKDLFNIDKGVRFNKKDRVDGNTPLVTAGFNNEGVSEYVAFGKSKLFSRAITIDMFGNSFYREYEFYCDDNIIVLIPKKEMLEVELVYLSMEINKNRFRYNYGRQFRLNKLDEITIPSPSDIPSWVYSSNIPDYSHIPLPFSKEKTPELKVDEWKEFRLDEMFEVSSSKNISNKEALSNPGDIPYLTTTGNNNGKQLSTSVGPFYSGNKLTIAGSGTILATFYQDKPFTTSQRLYILSPKFTLNNYLAMFLIPLIKQERYRFSYGRQVKMGDIVNMSIKLPADKDGNPDWKYMENYIKTLKFSKEL